jgi:hypothetical protein
MEKFLRIFPKIGRNFSENRSEFFNKYVGKFPRNFSLEKIPSYICVEIFLGTIAECTRNFSHGTISTFFWIFSERIIPMEK